MSANKTIWKFKVEPTIAMPIGARIIHVGHTRAIQARGELMLWAEVPLDPGEREERRFQVFGTGHSIPESATHLYTWCEGVYVWHLYELQAAQEQSE